MIWLNLIYVAGLLIVGSCIYSPFRSAWFARFLSLFTPLYFLPLLPLGASTLLLGDWIGLALLLIPLLLFVFEYGALFLPKPRTDVPAPQVRVMTWNTLYLNKDTKSALATIQREQPDIVALQELGVDLADGLADALSASHPHRALFPRNSPKGYGILSRFPIINSVPPNLGAGHYWSQQVTLCIPGVEGQPGREITLVSAHPRIPDIHLRYWAGFPLPVGFDTEPQDVQLRSLLQQIDQIQGPLLIVGDFNLSDRQPMYQHFASRLNDAQRVAGRGFGFTFPTDLSILDYFKVPIPALPMFPFLRLDYIFYDNNWQAVDLRSGTITGSDHRYLLADLKLVRG